MAERPFDGRTAIVTGGARGVGRGVALQLAELGCNVVVADPGPALSGSGANTDLLDLVQSDIQAHGVGCLALDTDVTDPKSVAKMVGQTVERFGAIDVLINNAGIMRMGWSWEVSEEDFDSVVKVHLHGQFNCLRRVLPGMRERGYGRILNMFSKGALGHPLNVAYSSAKSGVIGLTAACAVELEGSGVTVNAFAPSALSRMSSYAVGMSDADLRQAPVNDASFIAYLVSEDASDVNGQLFISRTGEPGTIDLYQRPSFVAALTNPDGPDVPWSFVDLTSAVEKSFAPSFVPPGGLTRSQAEAYVAKMTATMGLPNYWAN